MYFLWFYSSSGNIGDVLPLMTGLTVYSISLVRELVWYILAFVFI